MIASIDSMSGFSKLIDRNPDQQVGLGFPPHIGQPKFHRARHQSVPPKFSLLGQEVESHRTLPKCRPSCRL